MPVQDYYTVSIDEVYTQKDIRVDGVYTSLESVVKSSLASAAGKDLGLDDQFICACGRTIHNTEDPFFSREPERRKDTEILCDLEGLVRTLCANALWSRDTILEVG